MTLLFLPKKTYDLVMLFFILFWSNSLVVRISILIYNNVYLYQLNYVDGNTFVVLFYYQVKQNNQCVD